MVETPRWFEKADDYQNALATPQPVKLTVDDYMLLERAGAFADCPKTELIDGTILVTNTAYSRHARVHAALVGALLAACDRTGGDLEVLIEPSVLLDRFSLPQPDLAVFRDVPEDGPLPLASVVLAIEVADSSREFDLGRKAALYAAAGIAEYWVADTTTGHLHQMWQPGPDGYARHSRQAFGTTLPAATVPLTVELPGA